MSRIGGLLHTATMTKPSITAGNLVGYARVSSIDQNLGLQRDAGMVQKGRIRD